ncbi:hypothetical protein COV05_00330 [Candidatus Uhrbacteria bacterium CG10_big_fil_rev_8_21_14_0_10_48_16]|uniref:Glucose-6-phosphate isomerase n=1 Tax=Candidatus Uhrbacteria bacterium CG10_big_fil_rev_8_21_14_0_10_48_16 TaxID=1975038 RepID=A0A2M8LIF2_9BACT|nr:MAG: hypothetical protein COV05_00330 [Candidatus Uhrbacteria bacterium CG10_big_fil_rev_8_21_14_0_10_48_16]
MKFSYEKSLLEDSAIEPLIQELSPYRDHLKTVSKHTDYLEPESALQLPSDKALLENVTNSAIRLHSPTLQYIIVIGIGGSNLGTQAVYEAIAGSMNLLVDRLPKLIFLDTVTDEKMTAVTRILEHLTNIDDFLVITISKSGTTTEPIANTEVLWSAIEMQFGDPRSRFVFITDEGSPLWKIAEQKKIEHFSVPPHVGGRYSVFSTVGLLPLALAGIDIAEFVAGAKRAVIDGTSPQTSKNHALVSACLTHLHVKQGRTIHNSFLFSPKFEVLGKWYRQLMGESIGKERDLEGNPVHAGITPIVSIGSTDLHSMAQLYWGGPDDKYTHLISSFTGEVHALPHQVALQGLIPNINGKSLESIMQAIYGGVKSAYEKKERPYVEIDLGQADARELGYYLQFRMIEMMYLARLMNVNAFDQPAVELYKETTRELLT